MLLRPRPHRNAASGRCIFGQYFSTRIAGAPEEAIKRIVQALVPAKFEASRDVRVDPAAFTELLDLAERIGVLFLPDALG
ncbi:MAG: hypothetical protein ACOKSU_12735 [Pseudomonas sp.]|uniref:hypothetical protein n=1 Tax=Pseudomonas TaxID=286 RepID=UPI0003C0A15B|nr:hypothetical protein [Pseudomonas sp. VLB120]AGZ35285.1 hypothetical protein PVLB_12485 [Pseudomonas sp. VLB120]